MAELFSNILRRSSESSHSRSSSGETWILGTRYGSQQKERVRRHAASLIRLTYRCKFPAMQPYADVTSDSGWGCMLRTAQMLMAQALQRDMLGRDWRIPTNVKMLRSTPEYRDIVKWFLDYPGPPYVYSIHHLVQCGMRYDKLPGEWYGPSTAAHVLKDLASIHRRIFRGQLDVCVAQDGIVYKSEVERICTSVMPPSMPRTGSLGAVGGSLKEGAEHKDSSDDVISDDDDCCMSDHGADTAESTTGVAAAVGETEAETNTGEEAAPSTPQEKGDRMDPMDSGEKVSIAAERLKELMSAGGPRSDAHGSGPKTVFAEEKIVSDHATTKAAIAGSRSKQRSLKGIPVALVEGDSVGFFDPLFNPPPVPPKEPWNTALMLIVPLRLGKDKTDPENFHAIKSLFRSKYALGIMGGWVGHAVFFVGYRGDKLLGLDPHTTYNCPPPWHSSLPQDSFPSDKLMEEIHVEALQEMEFSQLDPSVAIAFYFRDRDEFDSFCKDKDDHKEVLEKHGPSGAFGCGVAARPVNPTVAAAAGSAKKDKKPFDIVVAAKHHYFSLFGIADVMPTFDDSLGDSVSGSKHREDWEIDSQLDEEDEDDDDEFIIV